MRKRTVRILSLMMAAAVAFSGFNISSFAAETEIVSEAEENETGDSNKDERIKQDETGGDSQLTEEESTDGEPTEEEPTDGEPTEEEPTDGAPTEEEPTDGEPTEEEPTDGEPTEEEPTDGEPIEEEPTDGEPTEEEPTDGEPTDEESTDGEHKDEVEGEKDEETGNEEEIEKDEAAEEDEEESKEKSEDDDEEPTISENDISHTVSDNTIELTVSGNNIKKNTLPKEEKDKKEYEDLLPLEMIPISVDKDESYIPEELVEIAESMPSYFSDSYDLYGDSYTSYYIYNQLDKETQDLWRSMEIVYSGYMTDTSNLDDGHAGIFKMKTNGKDIYGIMDLLSLFRYTHPQYYYLSNQIYCNDNFAQGDTYIHIGFGVYDKFQSGTERKASTQQIERIINSWSAEIASNPTEEEKIRTIHNKICDKVDYNDGVLEEVEGEEKPTITNEEEQVHFTQSAYSVFATNLTVCAGYTQAFTWLCNAMDIEAFGVTSPGHAWNKVKAGGEWYNVDCTWDDEKGTGNRNYEYYLRSDAVYDNDDPTNKANHQEESQWLSYLPDCVCDTGSGANPGGLPTISNQTAAPVINQEWEEDICTVTITSDTAGANIYYTMDGHTPSEARSKSYLYDGPFTVTEDTVVKAIAVSFNAKDSAVTTKQIKKLIQVEVTFVSGTETEIPPQHLNMGEYITKPEAELSKTGYTLEGWYATQNPKESDSKWDFSNQKVTKNMTLYAHWIPNIYTVTLDANQGYLEENQIKVTFDSSYGELPKPQRSGYEFLGWYTLSEAGEEILPQTLVTTAENHTLYAHWDLEFRIEGFSQESEELVYTGDKITQNISIYHKGRLLTENVDYILRYGHNVNAASYDAMDAPSVTIVMKGQYEGKRTLNYTILPRNINEDGKQGYEQVVAYQKQLTIPQPLIYFEGKVLVPDVDYVCDYSTLPENPFDGDSYEKNRTYTYEVRGTGNFTGTITMQLTVMDDAGFDLSQADIKLEKYTYTYLGTALQTEDVKTEYVQINGTDVNSAFYRVVVSAETPGMGFIYIEPTPEGLAAGYHGRQEIMIKLTAERHLQDALVGEDWREEIPFSQTLLTTEGGIYQKGENLLCWEEDGETKVLIEGQDYTVIYDKAYKTGNVTVTFMGIGKYTGSVTKNYRITPDTNLTIQWNLMDDAGNPLAVYQKDGTVPSFKLLDTEGVELKKGTHYSVRTQQNDRVGTMILHITGKGNYTGYYGKWEVEIIAGNIENAIMTVKDKCYSNKAGDWKSAVEIRDVNGRRLGAGKDYEQELFYRNREGMTIEPNSILPVGSEIFVTATGKNNYAGSELTGSYRIVAGDIKDVQIEIDTQTFTGNPIEPEKNQIHLYANAADRKNGIEISQDNYDIIRYENNTNVGLAKVILQGKGNYGGTRAAHFAIYKKSFDLIRVEEIILEESYLSMGIGQTKKLTPYIYPEIAHDKTVLWTSSNEAVATVDNEGNIFAIAEGTTLIEVMSADTGIKAVCEVVVQTIAVEFFELNTTWLEGLAGETYALTTQGIQPANATLLNAKWESSDDNIVSVDANGIVSLHRPGRAGITVTFRDSEYAARCTVWVKEKQDEMPEGNYLTPLEYKRAGDADDTASFNRAILDLQEKGYDTVYVPAGTYTIDALEGIYLKSNMKFIMAPDAVLKAKPNGEKSYEVIRIYNISNTYVSGGQMIGERYEHQGTDGEWGMGICIRDAEDIIITGVNISDFWGDGIYIGSQNDNDVSLGSENITVVNCILNNNRRNNLSIVNGDNVTIDGCTLSNANGTAPEYGIDIETNNSFNPCENVVISNCTFTGNKQACLGMITVSNGVTISNCTMNGNIINFAGKNVVISNSRINGCIDARTSMNLVNNTILNGGSSKEDTLVASFNAGENPVAFKAYNHNNNNKMLGEYRSEKESPSGQVFYMERTTDGVKDANPGYYLNVSDIMKNGSIKLERGCRYQFEYVIRGTGQWWMQTDQAGGYFCVPQEERFASGYTYLDAGNVGSTNRMIFYATDLMNGMHLEIDTINIYRVN